MAKTLKFAEWSSKVHAGQWVAFVKESSDEVVTYADSYLSLVEKVKDLRQEGKVSYSQVPPSNCSLIL